MYHNFAYGDELCEGGGLLQSLFSSGKGSSGFNLFTYIFPLPRQMAQGTVLFEMKILLGIQYKHL